MSWRESLETNQSLCSLQFVTQYPYVIVLGAFLSWLVLLRHILALFGLKNTAIVVFLKKMELTARTSKRKKMSWFCSPNLFKEINSAKNKEKVSYLKPITIFSLNFIKNLRQTEKVKFSLFSVWKQHYYSFYSLAKATSQILDSTNTMLNWALFLS